MMARVKKDSHKGLLPKLRQIKASDVRNWKSQRQVVSKDDKDGVQ